MLTYVEDVSYILHGVGLILKHINQQIYNLNPRLCDYCILQDGKSRPCAEPNHNFSRSSSQHLCIESYPVTAHLAAHPCFSVLQECKTWTVSTFPTLLWMLCLFCSTYSTFCECWILFFKNASSPYNIPFMWSKRASVDETCDLRKRWACESVICPLEPPQAWVSHGASLSQHGTMTHLHITVTSHQQASNCTAQNGLNHLHIILSYCVFSLFQNEIWSHCCYMHETG